MLSVAHIAFHVDVEQVGSYGRIDKATGNLIPQGSIYSDDFKDHLIDAGINIESGEHLPEECPEESEFTTWSENVKKSN